MSNLKTAEITTVQQLVELSDKHRYYASTRNYYTNEYPARHHNWEDFSQEFDDADIDMNLVYRWDVDFDENKYSMQITLIHQRRGIYGPHIIKNITDADVPKIISFLQKHFNYLMDLWKPFQYEET